MTSVRERLERMSWNDVVALVEMLERRLKDAQTWHDQELDHMLGPDDWKCFTNASRPTVNLYVWVAHEMDGVPFKAVRIDNGHEEHMYRNVESGKIYSEAELAGWLYLTQIPTPNER